MNKHISLVKKWLNDPDSVSQKELKDNAYDADEAAAEAAAAEVAAEVAAAAIAHRRWGQSLARNTAAAAAHAAAADADADAAATACWVKRYEELSK